MLKRYEIELDRNERDFATFLKSRKVTLSKTDLRVLIASRAVEDRISLQNLDYFERNLATKKPKAVSKNRSQEACQPK